MYKQYEHQQPGTNKSARLGYFLAGAGAAAWWLSKDKNRMKMDGWIQQAKKKASAGSSPLNKSFPAKKESSAQADKAPSYKLVEEGVQFAVDYYNKKQ